MTVSALTGLLDQLRTRRTQLAAQLESSLEHGRRSGREEMDVRERAMLSDLRGLDERIKDQQAEVDRAGTTGGVVGRLTRSINSAGRLAPLHFDDQEVRRMRDCALRGESCRLESRAFSTAESLLPAQLFPTPIAHQHDNRVLDRLPGYAMDTASIEFIRHTSTTGAAGPVAEGATKPEVVFITDQITAKAVKLAAHNACSYEVISDWPAWSDYCGTELGAQVVDVENNQLLSGDGLTGNMVGFYQTSGILSHMAGTTAPLTPIDHIEEAITELRVGPALATADLLVLHPSDWSEIRRTKDSQSRYLVAPDPTADEANQLWGVPVVVTTQNPLGKGLLLDTRKFGYVGVRESISMRIGYNADDFTRNLLRTVCEERLVLCVTRPSAVMSINGL